MIPKYPFIVRKYFKVQGHQDSMQDKSFETLSAALQYAGLMSSSPMVKRVQVLAILEELTQFPHNGH